MEQGRKQCFYHRDTKTYSELSLISEQQKFRRPALLGPVRLAQKRHFLDIFLVILL